MIREALLKNIFAAETPCIDNEEDRTAVFLPDVIAYRPRCTRIELGIYSRHFHGLLYGKKFRTLRQRNLLAVKRRKQIFDVFRQVARCRKFR